MNADLDDLDRRLLAELSRDGRAAISSLAASLGVTRATVRARMARLEAAGVILGYRAVLRSEMGEAPVRGIALLEVAGQSAKRITGRLLTMPEVTVVHSTHGRWDLVAEVSTETLDALDRVLFDIAAIQGVTRSETSLFLSSFRR